MERPVELAYFWIAAALGAVLTAWRFWFARPPKKNILAILLNATPPVALLAYFAFVNWDVMWGEYVGWGWRIVGVVAVAFLGFAAMVAGMIAVTIAEAILSPLVRRWKKFADEVLGW